MELGLAGRTALVTGASKGIGAACAERLAASDLSGYATSIIVTLDGGMASRRSAF